MYFFGKNLADRFEELEVVEDSLEGVNEYVEDSVEIVEDLIEDLEESREAIQDSLEKIEAIYLVYLYKLEIFGLDLICYVIFV